MTRDPPGGLHAVPGPSLSSVTPGVRPNTQRTEDVTARSAAAT